MASQANLSPSRPLSTNADLESAEEICERRIQALLRKIAEMELTRSTLDATLDSLHDRMDEMPGLRSSDEESAAINHQITEVGKNIARNIQRIADATDRIESSRQQLRRYREIGRNITGYSTTYEGDLPRAGNIRAPPPLNRVIIQRSPSVIAQDSVRIDEVGGNNARVPTKLPTFRGKAPDSIADPGEFLSQYAAVMRANRFPTVRWVEVLEMCSSGVEREWITNELVFPQIAWDEAQDKFLTHFQHARIREQRLRELFTFKAERGETIQHYADRFCSLLRQTGHRGSDADILTIFEKGLPAWLAKQVAVAKAFQPPGVAYTLNELINAALTIEASANDYTTSRDSHHTLRTEVRSIPTSDISKKTTPRCDYCGWFGHTEKICRNKTFDSKREADKKKTTTPSPKIPGREVTCHACGEAGHYATYCTKKKEEKTFSTKAVGVSEPAVTDDGSPSFTNISSINVPMMITDHKVIAVLDTGAEISIIDQNFAQDIGLAIIPQEGFINMAMKDQHQQRIGKTKSLEVQCGEVKCSHEFEIAPLWQGTTLLLGMDLFHQLGFGLMNIPIDFPKVNSSNIAKPSTLDKVAPLDTTKESLIVETNQPSDFMTDIGPALNANLAVPSTSFCNIPEATVHLATGESAPIYRRQYPIPKVLEPLLAKKVQKWIEQGVIKEAPPGCAWNSPIVWVAKKDEFGEKVDTRFCIDPRPINAILPDDKFPIPLVDSIFEKLGQAVVFSTLDLVDSYHQFPVAEEDQQKTAFTWNGKQWMFVGAPFGFKPLSSIFQRVMTIIFHDYPFVLVFIDDIVIFSNKAEDHATHVNEVLRRLTAANLRIRFAKCHFFGKSIKLLGHIISSDGIQTDMAKIKAVKAWPRLKTGKDIERFLGFVNYFRKFIPRYSTLAASLEALRKAKTLDGLWTPECDKSFNSLKGCLTAAPILSFPDFTQPFYIATDASNTGIGAVLYQLDAPAEGSSRRKERYISFIAKALSASERNYSTTKKELLGIVFALSRFRQYVWGTQFTLYTDHRALTYLFTQKHTNIMINGWLEVLLDFNFKIIHRPGLHNVLPDTLSRLCYDPIPDPTPEGGRAVATTKISAPVPSTEETAFVEAKTGKTCPPQDKQKALLEAAHLFGHFGSKATFKRIWNQGYYWIGIHKDCQEQVRNCVPCQRYNISREGFHPIKPISASLPWDHIAIDLAGPMDTSSDGNKFLFVLVDVFTRFVILRPIENKEAITIAKTLNQIFADFGTPKIIQSDNGAEFVNKILSEMVKTNAIDHRLTTPYNPRANGVAERSVQTAMGVIKKMLTGATKSWSQYVPFIQLAINTKIADIHGSAPFSLMFARAFNDFQDYSAITIDKTSWNEITKRHEFITSILYPSIQAKSKNTKDNMAKRFNRDRKIVKNPFPVGASVMIKDVTRTSKMDPRYEGPFTVVRRNAGGAYILQDATGSLLSRNVPINHMKMITKDSGTPEDNAFEIEAIINHQGAAPRYKYLVKWKGYSDDNNSWVPAADFNDVDIIKKYWKRRPEPGPCKKIRRG